MPNLQAVATQAAQRNRIDPAILPRVSSHLHLLPASLEPSPEKGYSTRQRVPVEGADLDALDAEVDAADGWRDDGEAESKSTRRARQGNTTVPVSWYVIPDAALKQP
jgi:hypothetical protein